MQENIFSIKQNVICNNLYLVGNFNEMRKFEKNKSKSGIESNREELEDFIQFIENIKLLDITLVGRKFIWYRLDGATKVGLVEFYFLMND